MTAINLSLYLLTPELFSNQLLDLGIVRKVEKEEPAVRLSLLYNEQGPMIRIL